MPSELLAIFAAIFFAGAFVVSKRGLADTSLMTGLLVILGAGWLVTAMMTLLDPPSSTTSDGILLFACAGLISPAIGFSAGLAGVHLLGPSIAVPIQQGGRPLIAVAAASILLGESVDAVEVLGMLAIVVGGGGLAMRVPDERDPARGEPRSRMSLQVFDPGLFFPLIAAMAFAAFDVFAKHVLNLVDEPTFGTMVVLGTSFLSWAVAAAVVPQLRSSLHLGANFRWLVLAGLLFGLAQLSIFHALARGDVSTVSPILASQPLIVFVLSRLLLRHVESVRPITVVLGSLVVLGTILLVA